MLQLLPSGTFPKAEIQALGKLNPHSDNEVKDSYTSDVSST